MIGCPYSHLSPDAFLLSCRFVDRDNAAFFRLSALDQLRVLHAFHVLVDEVTQQYYGLVKVFQGGMDFLVASGLYKPEEGQADRLVAVALQLQRKAMEVKIPGTCEPLRVRMALVFGEVAGGVVGSKAWTYQLFGNSVQSAQLLSGATSEGVLMATESFVELLSAEQASWKPYESSSLQLLVDNTKLFVRSIVNNSGETSSDQSPTDTTQEIVKRFRKRDCSVGTDRPASPSRVAQPPGPSSEPTSERQVVASPHSPQGANSDTGTADRVALPDVRHNKLLLYYLNKRIEMNFLRHNALKQYKFDKMLAVLHFIVIVVQYRSAASLFGWEVPCIELALVVCRSFMVFNYGKTFRQYRDVIYLASLLLSYTQFACFILPPLWHAGRQVPSHTIGFITLPLVAMYQMRLTVFLPLALYALGLHLSVITPRYCAIFPDGFRYNLELRWWAMQVGCGAWLSFLNVVASLVALGISVMLELWARRFFMRTLTCNAAVECSPKQSRPVGEPAVLPGTW